MIFKDIVLIKAASTITEYDYVFSNRQLKKYSNDSTRAQPWSWRNGLS